MNQERSSSLVASSVFTAIGLLLIASVVTHLGGFGSRSFFLLVLELPGQFLFDSFHLPGFFVPAVFLCAAVLITRPTVRTAGIVALNLSLLPFLTLSLSFRLIFGASVDRSLGTRAVAERFSALGGGVFLFALSLVLIVAVVRLARWIDTPPHAQSAQRDGHRSAGEPEGTALRKRAADLWARLLNRLRRPRPVALIEDQRAGSDPAADGWSGDEGERESESDDVDWTAPPVSQMVAESIAAVEREYQEQVSSNEVAWLSEVDDEAAELIDEGINDEEPEVWAGFVGEREAGYDDADLLEEDGDLDGESTEPDVLSVRFDGGRFLDVEGDDAELDDQALDNGALDDGESSDGIGAAVSEPTTRRPRRRSTRYDVPIEGLLNHYPDGEYWIIDDETRNAAEMLRVTLEEFQIQAEVTGIRKGPVITMFEILPAPGVKLAKITNLADNIALRLAAQSVRIVAPIPGKHAVGIEIPNRRRNIVSFGELLREDSFRAQKAAIPIALGKDIPGDAQIVDLTRMPHVLIAGATGSGKSVCVNSIICSVLYRRSHREVRMILIDPKIVELKFYNDIPHLLTPVITDPKRAFQALQWCIYEMERRYSLLDSMAVRDIRSYNAKVEKRNVAAEQMPYIVVVIDEFADLMQTSGKELESTVARLAAMSRAVGIHLVLATQRPSTDVITGLIKANIPSRIAFMVSSKIDSRIILDTQGAEKLLGQGDMLFTSAWDPFPTRMQGAFLSEDEVERVVDHVKTLGSPEYIDDEIFLDEDDEDFLQDELEDPLMEKAIEIVVSAKKASASYLQRRLKIGYNRAARLVEEMERVGIVGPQNGSKPRDIIGSAY